jgi:uncharacterized membrane protein YjdF
MHKPLRIILIISAASLALWGITQIGRTELIYDKFFTAFIILFILFTWKKFKYKSWAVAIALGAILLHNIYLYGNIYAGIPFDKIMHVIGAFALTVMLYPIIRKHGLSKNVVLWLILIAMGIAALHEIIEFLGYSYLGSGDGIFFFGVGDFGEWNNTMWDLISNLVGSIAGALTIHR